MVFSSTSGIQQIFSCYVEWLIWKKPQRIKEYSNYYKSTITVDKYAITVDIPPFSKMSAPILRNSLFYNSEITLLL